MAALIMYLHRILNQIKGFDNVGYSSQTIDDGYMMMDYCGKRYAVKIVEIKDPSIDPFYDLKRTHYYL